MARGKRSQAFGHNRERKARDILEADGWFVIRAPGSLGFCDLVALRKGYDPWLIEVKATAAGPFHSFGPADRRDLLAAASKAGGKAMLLYWPANAQPRYIFPDEWPS